MRKDGESPRRRRSVMVAETAGSHLAKGQTGSEEEAVGRHRGARAHNSILQMTSAGSPAASPTSRLTPSAANTSRDEVDEATRVAVMSASRRGGADEGGNKDACGPASSRKRALVVALRLQVPSNQELLAREGRPCDGKTEIEPLSDRERVLIPLHFSR